MTHLVIAVITLTTIPDSFFFATDGNGFTKISYSRLRKYGMYAQIAVSERRTVRFLASVVAIVCALLDFCYWPSGTPQCNAKFFGMCKRAASRIRPSASKRSIRIVMLNRSMFILTDATCKSFCIYATQVQRGFLFLQRSVCVGALISRASSPSSQLAFQS